MDLTKVTVKKTKKLLNESKVKAFVSITLDDCFVINNIKIIEGNKGLFLAFPSLLKKNGNRTAIAFPTNNEIRKKITERILEDYNNSQN